MSTIPSRTVSATVEIQGTILSLKDLRIYIRAALEAESIGTIRQVTCNVIQGTRKAKKTARR